jgi:glucose-6-phosphate isomerase
VYHSKNMTSFTKLEAVVRLRKLAQKPIDLTKDGVFTPQRIEQYRAAAIGFDLWYGTERVTDEVMQGLLALAEERKVHYWMAAMQAGEMLNLSEKRSVLHTAMRDQFQEKQTASAARSASVLAERELQKLERLLRETQQFTDLIQIGIGGSDLGPRALYLALLPYCQPRRRVHFLSNVDPDDVHGILHQVDLGKTLIVVVSKSGTTLETVTNEEMLRILLKKKGLDPRNHLFAVTGEKSPMDDPSKYRAVFYLWDYVGGRYSATSMVGGVALGFALGFGGFKEILHGAHAMDQHALTAIGLSNLPLLSALLGIWNRNFLQLPTLAILPYSQALIRFPAHLQQLDMESNGKSVDKEGRTVDFETGPVVWGEPGTNGQHSFYQLIHQGTDPIPVEFIGFHECQYPGDLIVHGTYSQEKLLANLFAQSIALATGKKSDNRNKLFPGNRPNRILFANRLDLFTMGALLAFYEHKVAFQGFIWNINSFDQEGVQLGKVLSNKILDLFSGKRKHEALTSFPLAEAYLRRLNKH